MPGTRVAGRRGRLPVAPPAERLAIRSLSSYLTTPLPPPVYPVDVSAGITDWGMLGNGPDPTALTHPAGVSDATFTGLQHYRMAKAAAAGEAGPTETSDQLVAEYLAYTKGRDVGASIVELLLYWYKSGRILAFAPVDHTNPAEIDAAMAAFHGVYAGVNLTGDADALFEHDQPWTTSHGQQPNLDDGHCVVKVAADGREFDEWVTWGAVQKSTREWSSACVEEAWVIITEEDGASASIDLAALRADIDALHGTDSVHAPTPVAPPQPQPFESPPAPPAPVPVIDEDVRFTVYRPRSLSPGQWASLLVYAHKTDPVVDPDSGPFDPTERVEAMARTHFGGDTPRPVSVDARQGLARGARLRIVPDLPGVRCNPDSAELDWWEPVHEALFRLLAGPDLAGSTVRGAIRVWCGPLLLGEVSVAIHVATDAPDPQPWITESVRRYRRIFPSYSHQDRAVVASFAEAARALGDQYLQDVLALRAGERWDARLLQLIEAADVFQLFWSSNSMRSQHCQDEWEHALALGRPLFIRPVYWEEPLPQDPGQELPPAALRELHFVKVPVAAQHVPAGVASYTPPPPGSAYGRLPPARFSRRPRALLAFSAVIALLLLIAVILAVVRR
jgi:TIR domain